MKSLLGTLALVFASVFTATAQAQDVEEPRAVVLVFARNGADENQAVRIERDLRNMFDYAHSNKPEIPSVLTIEQRFDVGHLSKGEIEKARMHFNAGQRALENNDAEEAHEQLFRAERFYSKALPYSSDSALLRGIFFYRYLVKVADKDEKAARDAYCAYVALTRSLSNSVGPIEQFEPLADLCGKSPSAGTGELQVSSNLNGAHVYIDDRAVGVVGVDQLFIDPFLTAGPHVVEVRKAGYVRAGELVTLKSGKSQKFSARLREAKNRKEEYAPLAELIFEGNEAFSEDYISDLFFQMAELYHAKTLVAGYLESAGKSAKSDNKLTIFVFDDSLETYNYTFGSEPDDHRLALQNFWQTRFGEALDPEDALPTFSRFAPTLFKVE